MKKLVGIVFIVVFLVFLCSALYSEEEDSPQIRRWSVGLQEWDSRAVYQLTNWTITQSKLTVELWERDREEASRTYTIRPYKATYPNQSFVFSFGVPRRTQITVPEGCEIHCSKQSVDKFTNTKGRSAVFYPGDVIYFTRDTPGFTIFPFLM